MSDESLVDRTITELRAVHDQLAAVLDGLPVEQLTVPSGAAEWTVADVLSHIGSGAEIGRYPLVAAATGEPVEAPANQGIWVRWNTMAPADQATAFVEASDRLIATLEGLSPEQRESIRIDLGFMPEPVPLATLLGMRLNELALHSWDARVGVDPKAALSEESAALLAQHFSSTMNFMLGFVGKPEGIGPARVALGDYTIAIDDAVRLETGATDTTATFEGPLEAAIRLLAGRLKPEYTPDGTAVDGNVSLDELRSAFPGY